jgi:hypothetical protein
MPTENGLYLFLGDGIFFDDIIVCLTNIHESYHA